MKPDNPKEKNLAVERKTVIIEAKDEKFVRLDGSLCRLLGLSEGDVMQVTLTANGILLTPHPKGDTR